MAAETKNAAWEKRYAKWDTFNDEEEQDLASDVEKASMHPTQFDHSGDEHIVFQDVNYLTTSELKKMKKLELQEKEVWQIVIRKLRVWSAASTGPDEGPEAIPCRPYCILINNLYPLGQVMEKSLCDPPEVYPSGKTVLQKLLEVMENPPLHQGLSRRRPGKVVFPDRNLVGELRQTLAAMNMECSYLSESEGIDEYVQAYSNLLVQNGAASIGEQNEKPGLLRSQPRVTPTLLQSLFSAVAAYVDARVVQTMPERHAIQITAGQDSVFASVLGGNAQDDPEAIHGLALFYSRPDLERRVLPLGEIPPCVTYPALRRCGACMKGKTRESNPLKKCTRCQVVYYCDADCQRRHWKVHKLDCLAVKDQQREDGDGVVWARREVSMLLGNITTMTFDDLDAVDAHQLMLSGTHDTADIFPGFVKFNTGVPESPAVEDLVWIERALRCFTALCQDAPTFLEDSLGFVLGLAQEPLSVSTLKPCLKSSDAPPQTEQLLVQNATVLTQSEIQELMVYEDDES